MKPSFIKLTALVTIMVVSTSLQAQQFNVLLFTKSNAWHHKSVNAAVTAMQELSRKHDFSLDWHEDPALINTNKLEQYDAIVFLLTNGDILDDAQKKALQGFVRSGKGFVGIHSASDTENNWDWYTRMVGRTFHIHPAVQTAELSVTDRNFPGLERMPDRFLWTDEWYEFGVEHSDKLNYILSVDETTYDPEANWADRKLSGEGMGDFHPIAWYQEFEGGRSFYTALGHLGSSYSDPLLMEHIYGGLYWAATGKGIRKD